MLVYKDAEVVNSIFKKALKVSVHFQISGYFSDMFCLYLTAGDDSGEREKRDDMRLNSRWDAPSQLI